VDYDSPMSQSNVFHGHPAYLTVWIITYWLCFVPEIVLSIKLRSKRTAQKSDRGSMLFVILAANLAIGIGFLSTIAFPAFAVDSHWKPLFDLGIVIWLSGALFRFYSMRTLGRFFTYDVAISTGQSLIEHGPYRWLRHPSYLGSLVAYIGFGMTLSNWLAICLPALCLGIAFAYRIRVEEQALVKGLGSPYQEYMRRTWRLIPFVF
jgi:protein-S-isoprenylcysteine O-methyltransferase Ste14